MLKNPYQGKFIVFEGLDGSGLSTQANLLKDFLTKKGFKVFLTKEPTKDSIYGKKIEKILKEKEKISPGKLQLLFKNDRKIHLEKEIIPHLRKGKIVISDRYFFSSFAFGSSCGLSLNWLIKINSKFPLPDLTIFLKVRPEISLQRIEKRGEKKTLFEKREKLEKVFKKYLKLAKIFKNFKIINGEKKREEVFQKVKKEVLKIVK